MSMIGIKVAATSSGEWGRWGRGVYGGALAANGMVCIACGSDIMGDMPRLYEVRKARGNPCHRETEFGLGTGKGVYKQENTIEQENTEE